MRNLLILSIIGVVLSITMGIYFNDAWYGVWFLFSVALGNIVGEIDKKTIKEDNILNDIKNPDKQLELIQLIRDGKIVFKKSRRLSGILLGPGFFKISWNAVGLPISFWHEDPGYASFSYLKINGEEMLDKLKYGSEIGLTIQDPKTDWIKK